MGEDSLGVSSARHVLYRSLRGIRRVIPTTQHRPIRTLARATHHIEPFNNRLRQRVSRLVRETLSFFKKLSNHIGAIKFFICDYNLTRA